MAALRSASGRIISYRDVVLTPLYQDGQLVGMLDVTVVEADGEPVLPAEVQVAFYRVAQEALNNIAKHAGASKAQLKLSTSGGRVRLAIVDDGCGFDAKEVRGGSLGLGIMRERATQVGAQLTINSEPGRGSTVTVTWAGAGRTSSTAP